MHTANTVFCLLSFGIAFPRTERQCIIVKVAPLSFSVDGLRPLAWGITCLSS